eukprot:957948-Pelagomonas_calceolata.AAC.1
MAINVAARPPPPPPRPVGRLRILPVVQAQPPLRVIWVQLLPLKLPGREEVTSMSLHDNRGA